MSASTALVRILLDTNVLVAAFATRGICRDIFRIAIAEHRLLVSGTILAELERILEGKLRTPAHLVREIVTFVGGQAEVVTPTAPAAWPERDPDDRWIAAAAIDGSADVLVTGDKDLLDADHAEDLRVVTPRGLWTLLRAGPGAPP